MNLGEKIKNLRIKNKITVEQLSNQTGINRATLYRYENSSIMKIPVAAIESISKALGVTPADLMREDNATSDDLTQSLPAEFNNPQEALAFILKMPTLAAFGGYDLNKMDDATLLEFANEILNQVKLVAYKYK